MSIFDQMKNKAQSQFKTAVRSPMQNMGNQKEAFTLHSGRRSNCKSRYHFRAFSALCAPLKERAVFRYG